IAVGGGAFRVGVLVWVAPAPPRRAVRFAIGLRQGSSPCDSGRWRCRAAGPPRTCGLVSVHAVPGGRAAPHPAGVNEPATRPPPAAIAGGRRAGCPDGSVLSVARAPG